MDKKYELLKDDTIDACEHTLYRIRALRDFGNVKAGDLGGYIEKEDNLSHDGECWVSGDAKVFDYTQVFGDAQVYGNAKVFDDAKVYDNACVYGDAKVFDNAQVYGNVLVHGNARVYGNAEVYGDVWISNARVSGNAQVSGNVRVSGYARVSGDAQVHGDAIIYDNAHVYDNARVSGDAHVYGNARVSGNAYIYSTNDYICIGPIGSRNGYTTFYLTEDKNIMVNCGCFNGTLEEFIKAVNETHKDNKNYKKQYQDTVRYAKSILYK